MGLFGRKSLDEHAADMEQAAREGIPDEPKASSGREVVPAGAGRAGLPDRFALPTVRVYTYVVFPALGAILVAAEAYYVFGMFELFAAILAALFFLWSLELRPRNLPVSTWAEARWVLGRWTFFLLLGPVAAGGGFLLVYYVFGVLWGYVTGIGLMCGAYIVAQGNLKAAELPAVVRGKQAGGIDDKLRAEYEKAKRQYRAQR